MSLYERLHEVQRSDAPEFGSGRDPVLDELRQRVHHLLIDEVGPLLYDRRIGEDELRRQLQEHLKVILGREKVPLSTADRTQLVQDLTDDVLGYGPISGLLADPDVSEVMVNGPTKVYIERNGKIIKSGASFIDENHLKRIIEKIVAQVGRRVDESVPMVDARLPDGSRVNAVIAPLAIGGPFLTIRKFAKDPFQVEDLINFGSFSRTVAQFLDACVKGRLNIIVSGGTGTGKTTALNVLSSFIPHDERIVTVEDAKELQLHQDHVLALEARPPNIEGKGEVRIRDLVRDTLSRIETMVLMAGMDLPVRAIREQMASAVDLIVHLTRLRDGTRRVTHVSEVQGMEGDVIVLQDLFLFDFGMGVDENGRFLGHLKSTGIRPKFGERLADNGIRLRPEIFAQ